MQNVIALQNTATDTVETNDVETPLSIVSLFIC